MTRMTRSAAVAAVTVAAAVTLATAGCGLGVLDPARPAAAGQPVVLTEHVSASVLVAVTSTGGAAGPLFQILAATARPQEHLDIVRAGGGTGTLVASVAPPPATVEIPAKPAASRRVHLLSGSQLPEAASALGRGGSGRAARGGDAHGAGHHRLGPPPAGPRCPRFSHPSRH